MERLADCLRFLTLGFALSLAIGCGTSPSRQDGLYGLSSSVQASRSAMTTPSCVRGEGHSSSSFGPLRAKVDLVDHPAIDVWICRFSADPIQRSNFEIYLKRAVRYVKPMRQLFESRGLPGELAYLPLVESGFSCDATSRSNAVGMWQFIESTGERYGLRRTEWVDDRRHLEKSTRAAADYLAFLHDMFKDWPLALAAYNAGENGVARIVSRSGIDNYWELIQTDLLPAETREYVPKFYAALKIIGEPARYGFSYNAEAYEPWFETARVPGGVSLPLLENLTGISESLLSQYNPELYKAVTPLTVPHYEIRVPRGKGSIVQAKGRHLKGNRMLGLHRHQVRKGETLYGLARKYRCSIKTLARVNAISPKEKVKTGQVLNVPRHPASMPEPSSRTPRSTSRLKASPWAGSKLSVLYASSMTASRSARYPVQEGDTLWSISQKFNISIQRLVSCNRLPGDYTILPGEYLNICND